MADVANLPPEQRAVLSLILERGKTYDEIAALLGIDAFAVRARAHAALDALAPRTASGLTPSRRAELSDYLLDQQDDEAYEATYHHLAASPTLRAWARVVAGELRTIAPEAIPEIPDEGSGRSDAVAATGTGGGSARTSALPRDQRSSRLGGALLIAGLAIALAVGAYLLFSGGDDGEKAKATSTVGTAASTTSTDATQQARPVAQINLLPPEGSDSKAAGLAQVLAAGNQRAIVIAGQGVDAGTYAVWLYTDESKNKLLGLRAAARDLHRQVRRPGRAAGRRRQLQGARGHQPGRSRERPGHAEGARRDRAAGRREGPAEVLSRSISPESVGLRVAEQLARIHDPGGIQRRLHRPQRRQSERRRPRSASSARDRCRSRGGG